MGRFCLLFTRIDWIENRQQRMHIAHRHVWLYWSERTEKTLELYVIGFQHLNQKMGH